MCFKQQLIHGEIAKHRAGSEQGSDGMLVLLPRTRELFHVPNSPCLGGKWPRQELVLSVRAEEPLIWRDPLCLCPSSPPCEGTEVMILWSKRSCLCRWKGTLSAGSLVFIDKCFRVHRCNFRWERWKGCKSFRHYIWNGIQWKPFRRDVWVKALRNMNLISLKYWMWNLVYFAIKNIIFKNILQIFFAPLSPEPASWS